MFLFSSHINAVDGLVATIFSLPASTTSSLHLIITVLPTGMSNLRPGGVPVAAKPNCATPDGKFSTETELTVYVSTPNRLGAPGSPV